MIDKRRWTPMVIALFVVVSTILPAVAETTTPPPESEAESPAKRRFSELMKVTDAGDEAKLIAYVRENFNEGMQRAQGGDPGIVPFLLDHMRRFHGFEVVKEVGSTADSVTMLVRPRTQLSRWIRYNVAVEPAPPYLVAGLFLLQAEPGEIPKSVPDLTPEAAVTAFGQFVDRAIASEGFSGVVLLGHGGDVALKRAGGEADREHHAPVTQDTEFGLASMNKMFTAVAIGQLVEKGRLAWDDPVGKHLHGWLPDDLAKRITVAQLLTHTSGLGDYLDQIETDPSIRNARSLAPYKELVLHANVTGKPEDGMRYSNTGYVVLGALIEAVTGRDYFEYVKNEVYARASMTKSGSWCRDEIVENRAVGYVPPDEAEALGFGRGWRSNTLLQGARGTSAGGGLSTAGDMFLFARALLGGKLVKPETLETLLTPRVGFLPGIKYGYGFVVSQGRNGERVFGHSGGFAGVDGELRIYGDGVWTLVVLSNVSHGAGEIVGAWDGILARIATHN